MNAFVQQSRFLSQEMRLDIDLELFVALSRLLQPSPPHRERLPVVFCASLRNALMDAAITASTVADRLSEQLDVSSVGPAVAAGEFAADDQPGDDELRPGGRSDPRAAAPAEHAGTAVPRSGADGLSCDDQWGSWERDR